MSICAATVERLRVRRDGRKGRDEQKEDDKLDQRQQRTDAQKVAGGEVSVRVADNQDALLIDEKLAARRERPDHAKQQRIG